MKSFNTQKELHDFIRSLHGKGTDTAYETGHELYELSSKDPDAWFGGWGLDYAGCSQAIGISHSSNVDGYEYTFWFEPDGSDTTEDDTIEDENGDEVYFTSDSDELANDAFNCF